MTKTKIGKKLRRQTEQLGMEALKQKLKIFCKDRFPGSMSRIAYHSILCVALGESESFHTDTDGMIKMAAEDFCLTYKGK